MVVLEDLAYESFDHAYTGTFGYLVGYINSILSVEDAILVRAFYS